jgi:peptidoglycan L-alanyl-D-glutamate endopeptidase CwlK
MSLSPRSLAALDGVHPVLDRLARAVAERAPPFLITEGRRTKERQAQLVKAKKSKTMNSRHITGHAIDFVAVLDGGRISYDDAHMRPIAGAFRDVAAEMGIKITRGIDWGWDSPHIELDRAAYPAGAQPAMAEALPPSTPEALPASAPNPLPRSGTVWGSIVGALAGAAAWAEQSLSSLLEWSAKLAEFSPVSAALASMGGNVKSISLGLGIGAAVYVVSRRVKASQEGKPG